MKISNQLKELIEIKHATITDIATTMNTTQSNLSNKLGRDNLKLSDLKGITDALGYYDFEIVARNDNQTIIIRDAEPIQVLPHTKYLAIEGNKKTVIDYVEENPIMTFKDLLMEVIYENMQEEFEAKFGDMLTHLVPNEFKVLLKESIRTRLSNK